MNISNLLRAPSIKASWYYAVSGACFAIGTLLMARILEPTVFGVVALAIAITNVGVAMGSAGMSGVRLRHDLHTDELLLRNAIGVMGATGVALGVFGIGAYALEFPVAFAIVAAVSAGGMALLGLVPFQKAHRFEISVPLAQVGNLALLLSAGILWALPATRLAWLPTACVALAFGTVALWAWRNQWQQGKSVESFGRHHRHDAFQFTAFSAAEELMWQLERLLIPILLSIEDLAAFAVVGAIAIAPYHVLASGAGATLIPRLQAESVKRKRRALLVHETQIMLGLAALGGVVILLVVPGLVEWYLGPKIVVTQPLLLAAVAGGTARILASIARAPAVAFGTSRELRRVSAGAWLAVVVGILAAWALAGFGLIGLIAGVTLGWLARGAAAMAVVWHHVAGEVAESRLDEDRRT